MKENKAIMDPGPLFHGTKARLNIGDLLEPLHASNYQDRRSVYIYFTASLDAVKWGGELAVSDALRKEITLWSP